MMNTTRIQLFLFPVQLLLLLLMMVVFIRIDNTTITLAQESPDPDLQLPIFGIPPPRNNGIHNGTRTHRYDFCDLSNQVLVQQTLTLDKALNGVAIHPVIMVGEFAHFDTTDDGMVLSEDHPGLIPMLLDEICRRAGCTWRDSYAIADYTSQGLPENKTFLDLLLWSTDVYDLSADWWMRSVQRLRAGATFTEQFYDATIILVMRVADSSEQDEFDPWGWLAPFDTNVWILTIVCIIFSSMIYWLLHVLDPNSNTTDDNCHLDPIETTWSMATAFAGQFEFEPQTSPARLFTFSIAFWALLMGAAYTANLASFLVIRNRPQVTIESLEQAVRMNMNMCVWKSSQTDVTVSSEFPTYARSGRLIRTDQRGVYEGLRNGDCDVAITEMSSWDMFQYDEDINGDCSLAWIGRPFVNIPASFGVKSDAGTFCTSLMRDAFNLFLHDMQTDGTMDELWDTHIKQTATVFCTPDGEETSSSQRRLLEDGEIHRRRLKAAQNAGPEGGGGGDDDTTKLTLINMGGVFLFHGILSALSVLCALVPWIRQKMQGGNATTSMMTKEEGVVNKDGEMRPSTSSSGGGDDIVDAAAVSEMSMNSDKMFYFDATSSRSVSGEAMEELREKLNGIEEKLALLLEKKEL